MNREEVQLEFKVGRQHYYAVVVEWVVLVGWVERSGTHQWNQWNEMTSSLHLGPMPRHESSDVRPFPLFE
jgi:hypothetical protein